MKITAWRIFKKKHRASAFAGEGARRFGGRWNSKGVAIIYTSGTVSLAVLEILVHLETPRLSIGDNWVGSGVSAVLRVPSVIIPSEFNYLLNPVHEDFRRCVWGKPRLFKFDPRLAPS